MAIQSNASTEAVAGAGVTLYSGLTNMKVLGVNPTMAELHAMGVNVKQEPSYKVTFSDQDYNKIVFWVGNADTKVKVEILMQPNTRTSQTGKKQWINSFGATTWSEDAPSYDWWKAEGQRPAFVGEETLIEFTKAWANVAAGDEVSYDNINAIASGDISEIKALCAALTSNEVRLLVGVKDDKYQTVYTKCFGRIKPQRDQYFIKSLNDDYGSFNADFNADLVWGVHTPTASLVKPDAPAEDEDWTTAEPAMANGQKSDDLPF